MTATPDPDVIAAKDEAIGDLARLAELLLDSLLEKDALPGPVAQKFRREIEVRRRRADL